VYWLKNNVFDTSQRCDDAKTLFLARQTVATT